MKTKKIQFYITICYCFFQLNFGFAQTTGLIVPSETSLILSKLNKRKDLNLNDRTFRIQAIVNKNGLPTTFKYKGSLLEKKEGILIIRLLKPPKTLARKVRQPKKIKYSKKGMLIKQEIALQDIASIRLIGSNKKPLAVIGDTVGFLGGVTFGTTLFLGIGLRGTRPDLVGPGVIPFSILGLGLSYLATRIGHSRKYKTKAIKKGEKDYWVIN